MVRHASREQFATWHDTAQTAQPCRLDRLRDTEMARLGTPYCGNKDPASVGLA